MRQTVELTPQPESAISLRQKPNDFRHCDLRRNPLSLAYSLANFLRRLALPQGIRHWSLTTLREELIKIGAKNVRHARYVTFQLAEVAVPRKLFREILRRIARLKTKRLSLAPG